MGGGPSEPRPLEKNHSRSQELFSQKTAHLSPCTARKDLNHKVLGSPKPSASMEFPFLDPVPKANCPGLIVSGSWGLKEDSERGARAGRVV